MKKGAFGPLFCGKFREGRQQPRRARAPHLILCRRLCVRRDRDRVGAVMPKLSFSENPLLLGFDQFDRILERAAKTAGAGAPPFNIEQAAQNSFRITVAVAGYRAGDLSVSIENRQLVLRGDPGQGTEARVFLHRGISHVRFQRSFVLADGIEVVSARLANGLLVIELERKAPEYGVKQIAIECG